MKLTVLTENTVCREGLVPEHGVSLYIETGRHRILFDMGQSDLLLRHAEILNIPLDGVDIAVLSHGHYDHGGGLSAFLEVNRTAPVYLSEHAFGLHYRRDGSYIGLDPALRTSARLVPVGEYMAPDDGLELFSCNLVPRPYPADTAGLCMADMLPEDFRHEQYLLIREGERRILVSGCSHKGVLNLLEWFSPDVLIGGFHLNKMPTEGEGARELERIAECLQRAGTRYYTCHCTGMAQYDFLKKRLGERISYLSCGMTLTV